MMMITITIMKESGSKIISFTHLLCKQLKCGLFTDFHEKDNYHFEIISLLTIIMMTFIFLWKKTPMTSRITRSYECEDGWKSKPCLKQSIANCRHRIAQGGQFRVCIEQSQLEINLDITDCIFCFLWDFMTHFWWPLN